jgi:hypothetical protein
LSPSYVRLGFFFDLFSRVDSWPLLLPFAQIAHLSEAFV